MRDGSSAGPDAAMHLGTEVAGYESLLKLLRDEQDALRSADVDALERIAQSKLTLVYHLQDLGAVRARALADAGLDPNPAGMTVLLARSTQPQQAAERWDSLVELATEAQRQNALNSRLASVQRRHVDRAMAALWSAAGCMSTYGSDGRSQHQAAPRSIAAI